MPYLRYFAATCETILCLTRFAANYVGIMEHTMSTPSWMCDANPHASKRLPPQSRTFAALTMPTEARPPSRLDPEPAHLRLVPSDGSEFRPPRKPRRPTPKRPYLTDFERASAAAENIHDVLKRLHQAVIGGDEVVVRALARMAERKAANVAALTKMLLDLSSSSKSGRDR